MPSVSVSVCWIGVTSVTFGAVISKSIVAVPPAVTGWPSGAISVCDTQLTSYSGLDAPAIASIAVSGQSVAPLFASEIAYWTCAPGATMFRTVDRDHPGLGLRRRGARRALREAGRRRRQETGAGLRTVRAVDRDLVARVVEVPQRLERVNVAVADRRSRRVIEVDHVAGDVVHPAVRRHRLQERRPVLEIDRAAALVVRRADRGGGGDPALAGVVPGDQQILLGERAQRAVDLDRAAGRLGLEIVAASGSRYVSTALLVIVMFEVSNWRSPPGCSHAIWSAICADRPSTTAVEQPPLDTKSATVEAACVEPSSGPSTQPAAKMGTTSSNQLVAVSAAPRPN